MSTLEEIQEFIDEYNKMKTLFLNFADKAKKLGIEITANHFNNYSLKGFPTLGYLYHTKDGQFYTKNYNDIPEKKLNSPDDNTPALIYLGSGEKYYYKNGLGFHNETAPAYYTYDRYGNEKYQFGLNGLLYRLEEWLQIHPNQNENFKQEMREKYKNLTYAFDFEKLLTK
jgi:hypothetical protein